MATLEARGLEKSFAGRRGEAVRAVRGVDLGVARGEVFGLLGPNGAGKTTTLRMLATLLEPDGGEATVAGCDLRREPARVRRGIGYVGQTGGADRSLTGREDLTLQARLYGVVGVAQRVENLVEAFELAAFADRPVRTLSGGQRRRLELALGLVHEPSVLFLDEPTAGLDPQSRSALWEEIGRLRAGGTTVLITTHYMDEADALCDRLAIVDRGEVVAEGTPAELKQRIAGDVVEVGLADGASAEGARADLAEAPFAREVAVDGAHLRLYVESGEEALPTILRYLDRAGISVRRLSLSRPTLDDVFLKRTGSSLREADRPVEEVSA